MMVKVKLKQLIINKEKCFEFCNKTYKSLDPKRIYCKKGCSGDGTM